MEQGLQGPSSAAAGPAPQEVPPQSQAPSEEPPQSQAPSSQSIAHLMAEAITEVEAVGVPTATVTAPAAEPTVQPVAALTEQAQRVALDPAGPPSRGRPPARGAYERTVQAVAALAEQQQRVANAPTPLANTPQPRPRDAAGEAEPPTSRPRVGPPPVIPSEVYTGGPTHDQLLGATYAAERAPLGRARRPVPDETA